MTTPGLQNLLHEDRSFPPDPAFTAQANATPSLLAAAADDRLGFWADQAERLDWAQRWDQVLDWSDAPFAKWFVGGRLNVAVNCVDRHVAAGNGDRVALHFEGEPGDTRTITYAELAAEVCPGSQRTRRPGRAGRGPGRDLPADDPRGGHRDAGLRPDRRRRTPWSSAGSPPRRCARASTTPRPSW